MQHLNIEIKAICKDKEFIKKILRKENANYIGLDHQIDTYFKTNKGRLKLREGNIENYLIFYDRENKKGPKQSNVALLDRPDSRLKKFLKDAFEILVIVDKQREIYFIGNVKFHLDNVKDLGTFVEIEAIDSNNKIGQEKLKQQCQFYLDLFKIQENDLIDCSYSDLLLKK